MNNAKSIAHKGKMNHYGEDKYPDGLVPWSPAEPPNLEQGTTQGSLRKCWYCGSMHPADLAAAISAGATGSWADWKYGWPHKAHFNGIPYLFAGMLESYGGISNPPQNEIDAGKWIKLPTRRFDPNTGEPVFHWCKSGEPAKATTHGKFYSVHLQDATPEDRKVIENYLGLQFDFKAD